MRRVREATTSSSVWRVRPRTPSKWILVPGRNGRYGLSMRRTNLAGSMTGAYRPWTGASSPAVGPDAVAGVASSAATIAACSARCGIRRVIGRRRYAAFIESTLNAGTTALTGLRSDDGRGTDRIRDHLPDLRSPGARTHADRRVPVLLHLHPLRRAPAA